MDKKSTAEVFNFAQEAYHEAAVVDIEQLAQAGSDRIYYRIRNGVNRSIIATQSANVEENERFISLSNYFDDKGISVPQILAVNSDRTLYLQTDAGNDSLLDLVLANGHTEEVKHLYKKALQQLIEIQLCANGERFQQHFEKLNSFGYEQIIYDLNYFKINFLEQINVDFDETKLSGEFEHLAKLLDKENSFFMYRDFQGRNIMIQNGHVVFIDFQGGLKGHPLYDVASLLWQAKAKLPKQWKSDLLEDYLVSFEAITLERGLKIDIEEYRKDYHMLTLTRLLQVLGAYGLRGLKEGKGHFISSIPLGLLNIGEWLSDNDLPEYPELSNVLACIAEEKFIEQFK